MVLKRILPLLAVALAACLPRPAVMRAPEKTTVVVAYVVDGDRDGSISDVPAGLRRDVEEALRQRGLEVKSLAFDSYAKVFRNVRDSQRRLAKLTNSDAGLVLLVETKAAFFSPLNGRYRWTVYARMTAARKDGVAPLMAMVDEPAFLDYEHEREPQALETAAGAIARRAGALLDDFLGSVEGTSPSGSAADPRAQAIYFVMVDRFVNGDRTNDGKVDLSDPAAFHGGDLQGVIDRLDDLKAMGVGTLWLSPVFQMRTEKFFGHGAFHGYWTEDLTRVEPRLGDEALLRKLSDELHRRDMRLVLDLVLNHVAMDAPLTRAHPDWFHRQGALENWSDPEQLVNRDVHGLPDLAQEKPEVYDFLLQASLRWIEAARPDGFRLDAVKHVPQSFWARFNDAVRARAGSGFLLLGEMLDGDAALIARVQRQGHFGAMFDFPLYFALVDVFCRDQSALKLGAALTADRAYDDADSLVTLLDNHDLPRIASDCGGDLARVRRALAFQLTARGTPSLTWGTECASAGKGEPENRADLCQGPQPLRDDISELLAARRAHPALVRGAPRVLAASEALFAYARISNDEAALIAVNQGDSAVEVEAPQALAGVWRDVRSGRELGRSAVPVPARSVLVAVQTAPRPGGFAEIAAQARQQSRRGERKRLVQVHAIGGPADGDLFLVGSGPEMGAWNPEMGLGPLDSQGRAQASLPEGSVYEYKLVVKRRGGTEWERRGNRALFVREGSEPLKVDISWNS